MAYTEQSSSTDSHPPSPRLIYTLAQRLSLPADKIIQLMKMSGLMPAPGVLIKYIDKFLLLAGVAFIVAGIAAFFAFNWAELHKFYKFGLIQTAILICTGLTWYKGIDSLVGKGALFAAAFLVGVLFAVYGQVYQTGADPYGMFLAWMCLVLPLAIIGRQAGLWFLITILANITLILFWFQVLNPQSNFFASLLGPVFGLALSMVDPGLSQFLLLLNLAIVIIWYLFARNNIHWMQIRWFPRIVVCLVFYIVTVATISQIFNFNYRYHGESIQLMPLWFLLISALSIWFYQSKIQDLFILAVTVFCVVIVLSALFSRNFHFDAGSALFMAIILILQITAATYWLRYVINKWKQSRE